MTHRPPDKTDAYWRLIRAQRADPPGLSSHDETRRNVFQAALAQAEELWDAGRVAGPQSRALPLFYALSQAGRAVCAAWTVDQSWEPRSHGLSRAEPAVSEHPVGDYGCTVAANGSFPMVAAATRSASFTGKATVAQLWASVHEFPQPETMVGSAPQCLKLAPTRLYSDPPNVMDFGDSIAHLLSPRYAFLSVPEGELSSKLAPYPAAAGHRIEQTHGTADMFGVTVSFPDERGDLRALSSVGETHVPPGGSLTDSTYLLRPAIGTAGSLPPSRLMVMWALLFCLSQLTRYYPAGWVAALDPDKSEIAVTLEHGLDLMLELVPELVVSGLRGPIDHLVQERIDSASSDEDA